METLADVMGQKLPDFAVVEAYYLRYDHGLMAFTPAIRRDTREMVVCLNLTEIKEVGSLLEAGRREKAVVESRLFLTNGQLGFFLDPELKGKAKAVNVVSHQDIELRCMSDIEPYCWASM